MSLRRPYIWFPIFFASALLALFSSVPRSISAPSSTGTKSDGVKIGFVTSLTGLIPWHNKELVNGFNLYLDEIGHKMAGKPVELIVEDDESKPAKCVDLIRRLVTKDHVCLLTGIFFAPIAYRVAPVVNNLHIPLIISSSAADDMTQRQASPWVIRVTHTGSQGTHCLGDYAFNTLHYKRVAIICGNQPYCFETAGGFQKAFEEAGGKVVQKVFVGFDEHDYTEPIKDIRKNVDAVFVALSNGTQITFAKEYRQFGPKAPILSVDQFFSEQTLKAVGKDLVGSYCTASYTHTLPNAVNARFVKAYRAKFGDEPGVFAANGYAAAMWINKTADAMHGDLSDRDKVMQYLRKLSLDVPHGAMKLDDYGQAIQDFYICRVEKANGRYENKVVFTYPKVSQFFKWKPAEYMKEPVYSKRIPACKNCEK